MIEAHANSVRFFFLQIRVYRGKVLSETLVRYVRLQFVCYYVHGVRYGKNFNYA